MAINLQLSEGPGPNGPHWLAEVKRQVNSLRFGVVQIVVHNSRVTQIDRTERLRLAPPSEQSFANPSSTPPDHWKE